MRRLNMRAAASCILLEGLAGRYLDALALTSAEIEIP